MNNAHLSLRRDLTIVALMIGLFLLLFSTACFSEKLSEKALETPKPEAEPEKEVAIEPISQTKGKIKEEFEKKADKIKKSKEFAELREERMDIDQELLKIKEEIKSLDSKSTKLRQEKETLEFQIHDVKSGYGEELKDYEIMKDKISNRMKKVTDEREKDKLEAELDKYNAYIRKIKYQKDYVPQWEERLKEIKNEEIIIDNNLKLKKLMLDNLESLKRLIEDRINYLLTPETAKNEFKTRITYTFAALVGIVIAGFFIIAYKYDKVREAIFSGESGIQFLTLFSLVIAIILFGITGILEGKELAALLGGLSGYILGRTGIGRDRG